MQRTCGQVFLSKQSSLLLSSPRQQKGLVVMATKQLHFLGVEHLLNVETRFHCSPGVSEFTFPMWNGRF